MYEPRQPGWRGQEAGSGAGDIDPRAELPDRLVDESAGALRESHAEGTMSAASEPATRFLEVDLLKALGILCVPLIHLVIAVGYTNRWTVVAVTTWAVPGFFFASGFLYQEGPALALPTVGRRLRRLLLPYATAGVLTAVVQNLQNGAASHAGEVLLGFLLGTSWGAYYFVFVLTIFILLTPALARLSDRTCIALFVAAVVVQQLFATEVLHDPLLDGWRSPFTWGAYFLFGWVVKRHYGTISRRLTAIRLPAICALALLTLVWIAAFTVNPQRPAIYRSVYAYGVLALLVTVGIGRPTHSQLLCFLSDRSYPIYLFHWFFLLGFLLLPSLPWTRRSWVGLLAWSVGVCGPLLLVAGLRRVAPSWSRTLVGA